MVKLRLARQGRKKVPIYKIVATDSRSRRDGRFLESLGQYRPSNEPGQKIQIKEDRALYWLNVGAQPSDTVRSLLSREGILLKWHLEKKKVDPARASEIFNTWKTERDAKYASAADAKQRAREEARRKAAKKAPEAAAPATETSTVTETAATIEAEATPATSSEAPQALGEPSVTSEAGLNPEGERNAESVEG